jgi:preprotein translocase subunit Sec63
MSYKKFEESLDILKIVSRATNDEVKQQYKKLSRKYHPDMQDGDIEKFKEINEAYKVVQYYINNFRFSLDEEEFQKQNPIYSSDWYY